MTNHPGEYGEGLVMDQRLDHAHPARVPFILNALENAQISDAIAGLN